MKSKGRLRRILMLQEAVKGLPDRTLLHAGPPYRGKAPNAVVQSAAQAALIAGWADDLATARRLIETGEIKLQPGQDHGVAVPLAMVVGPSMWCVEVGDGANAYYAPMSEGPPPALRFGSDAAECRDRARDWCARAAAVINSQIHHVPPLDDLMRAALQRGDECHAVTAAGNQLFIDALGDCPAWLKQDLLGNPGFVLTIWMAWAGWTLANSTSAIAAIGGNGFEFGWRPKGAGGWHTTKAETPRGSIFNKERSHAGLGAIGDSAVIDLCGLGGQALQSAPDLLKEWAHVLPDDVMTRHQRILDAATGMVAVPRVIETGTGPIVNLAIVDQEGGDRPIGRGIYIAPPELFERENGIWS